MRSCLHRIVLASGTIVFLFACGQLGTDAPTGPPPSINDTMISVITPATNTLWGVEDPTSDGDWKSLRDAADATLAATKMIKHGGSGANDTEWARNPEWQAFADTMLAAAQDAREAIEQRDLEALLEANDVLYPPCENCHNRFHPGLNQQ